MGEGGQKTGVQTVEMGTPAGGGMVIQGVLAVDRVKGKGDCAVIKSNYAVETGERVYCRLCRLS